eukprot:GILI01001869.1.p1 GENE.GILI01001869.1~~GILI01001869.1.p1  ORF type:complete len:616 (+),score=155.84 GILI01001869.1:186-1850(+)
MLFIGDPLSLEIHLAIAILLGPCATAGDRSMARYARYILSPFIDAGPAMVALAHGIASTVLFAIHGLGMLAYARHQRVSILEAMPKTLFPSVSFGVALLLYPGTLVSITDMARDGNGTVAAFVLAVLHALWVPAVVGIALYFRAHTGEYIVAAKRHGCIGTVFGAVGVWEPNSQRFMIAVRGIVTGSKFGRLMMIGAILFAIIVCLELFLTIEACGPRLFIGSALFAVAAVTIGAARPFVTLFSNIMTVVALSSVGVVLLVHGIAVETDFAGAKGGEALWVVKLIALLLLFISTVLRTLHQLLLLYLKAPKPARPFGTIEGLGAPEGLYEETKGAVILDDELSDDEFDSDDLIGEEEGYGAVAKMSPLEGSGSRVVVVLEEPVAHVIDDSDDVVDDVDVGEDFVPKRAIVASAAAIAIPMAETRTPEDLTSGSSADSIVVPKAKPAQATNGSISDDEIESMVNRSMNRGPAIVGGEIEIDETGTDGFGTENDDDDHNRLEDVEVDEDILRPTVAARLAAGQASSDDQCFVNTMEVPVKPDEDRIGGLDDEADHY